MGDRHHGAQRGVGTLGALGPSVHWTVREALAFDGYPRTAWALARQIGEPLRAVIVALRTLEGRGEIRYLGRGRWVSIAG